MLFEGPPERYSFYKAPIDYFFSNIKFKKCIFALHGELYCHTCTEDQNYRLIPGQDIVRCMNALCIFTKSTENFSGEPNV